MKPITSSEKKELIKKLNERYGITELNYLILKFGMEKLRLYSGNLSKEELINLDKNLRIENIGLYFANIAHDMRLTLDGAQLLKDQITKNIIELNKEQSEDWLKGENLEINAGKSFKILRFDNEFIGCGKSTGIKITNFFPKERRVK